MHACSSHTDRLQRSCTGRSRLQHTCARVPCSCRHRLEAHHTAKGEQQRQGSLQAREVVAIVGHLPGEAVVHRHDGCGRHAPCRRECGELVRCLLSAAGGKVSSLLCDLQAGGSAANFAAPLGLKGVTVQHKGKVAAAYAESARALGDPSGAGSGTAPRGREVQSMALGTQTMSCVSTHLRFCAARLARLSALCLRSRCSCSNGMCRLSAAAGSRVHHCISALLHCLVKVRCSGLCQVLSELPALLQPHTSLSKSAPGGTEVITELCTISRRPTTTQSLVCRSPVQPFSES